jgi:hypothetical protein
MKTLTILLPDLVSQLVDREAQTRNVESAALCSGVITEHFLAASRVSVPATIQPAASPRDSEPTDSFDVRRHFPGYPLESIRLAQEFVDEALRIPNCRAFASGRGIGIEPNFVFVQYLQKRAPGGVGLSFYGKPDNHFQPNLLRPGRNPNYSKAIALDQQSLKPFIREIRRSYELKFGRIS